MSDFDKIQSLLQERADCNARINLIPYEGEVFDFDWNIDEYRDDDWFTVYDNNDVLQMIQTLTKGLKIPLKDEGLHFLI